MIKDIQESVSIPVMAKARIGHFAEAQVLESSLRAFCNANSSLEFFNLSNF